MDARFLMMLFGDGRWCQMSKTIIIRGIAGSKGRWADGVIGPVRCLAGPVDQSLLVKKLTSDI